MCAPIKFPALAIDEAEAVVEVINSLKELSESSRAALAGKYYDRVRLVDSEGNAFRIGCVQGRPGPSIFQRLRLALMGRARSTIVLEHVSLLSLDEVKREIEKVIDRDPVLWSASTGDHEDVKARTMSSTSFGEVIAVFLTPLTMPARSVGSDDAG